MKLIFVCLAGFFFGCFVACIRIGVTELPYDKTQGSWALTMGALMVMVFGILYICTWKDDSEVRITI